MPKPSTSSGVASWPSKSSRASQRKGNAARQPSRTRSTRAKNASGKSAPGRPSGRKNRNRRSELLKRLKIDEKALDSQPQIAPLLKQCGILPARVIEVLRADQDEASRAVIALWDELTPANRNLLGLEGLAAASGISPRRLWEVYAGATMMQTRESIGVMIANALPSIMAVTIKDAKKVKGVGSREHIFKAARVLPTPKGSVINIGTRGDQSEQEPGDEREEGGMLEGADDFLMKASRAMAPKTVKALPEPEILAPEDDEDGEDGE